MIDLLTIAVPKDGLVDRSGFDPVALDNFERVTGIKETRRWGGTATELAVRAALRHVERVPNHRADIDTVICVTQSPDRKSPCMAAEVHRELGLPSDVAVFDVNQSCDGFLYGLEIGRRVAGYRTLLICVDKLRAPAATLDSLIFSDAAAVATVYTDDYEMGDPLAVLTDGSGAGKLCADSAGELRMDGGAVFDFVTSRIPEFILKYSEKDEGPSPDFLCQHQSNLSMMKLVDARSKFSGRSLYSIEKYGNQSMCGIPTALALNEEKIIGKRVLLCGYGAGYCAAALAVDWAPRMEPVSEIVEI